MRSTCSFEPFGFRGNVNWLIPSESTRQISAWCAFESRRPHRFNSRISCGGAVLYVAARSHAASVVVGVAALASQILHMRPAQSENVVSESSTFPSYPAMAPTHRKRHSLGLPPGLGERLKEERKRLGLSQEDFGEILGRDRRTIYSYESCKSPVDTAFLDAFARVGGDVRYVLFGQREAP